MSIKHFKNAVCETCKAETLHIALKCSVCGTVIETPTAQRWNATKRIFLKRKREGALALFAKAHSEANKANKEWQAANFKPSFPTRNAGVFGKGRERFK